MSEALLDADEIRARFARAMSDMYRAEVPQYGALLALVEEVNDAVLARDPIMAAYFRGTGQLARVAAERHGAIRVGTAAELALVARAFAVMGMVAVGYYDLAPAGLPVHSTAFRPLEPDALREHLSGAFASWQLPDGIEFLDEIPRTSTGKFWKARLREQFANWKPAA